MLPFFIRFWRIHFITFTCCSRRSSLLSRTAQAEIDVEREFFSSCKNYGAGRRGGPVCVCGPGSAIAPLRGRTTGPPLRRTAPKNLHKDFYPFDPLTH